MAELITEEQPRIKFATQRTGQCVPLPADTPGLQQLIALCQRMEAVGAAPVLNDGLVGGNAALLVGQQLWVTRSGKPPALHMAPADFVAVDAFDEAAWSASYRSATPEQRPTSDTPLLAACLAQRHDWPLRPRVALHGHALATEGPGLDAARRLGLPVSERETLFSTLADLQELQKLLRRHPYPGCRCYIRRGHGFFMLADSVDEAAAAFEELIVPHIESPPQPRNDGA